MKVFYLRKGRLHWQLAESLEVSVDEKSFVAVQLVKREKNF